MVPRVDRYGVGQLRQAAVSPLPDGQHDRLPPHIRYAIDAQLARMQAEDRIGAAAAAAADRQRRGAGLRWVWLPVATALVGLCLVAVFAVLGQAAGRPSTPVHTPATHGVPRR